MSLVKYNEWIIDIHDEKTKQLYSNITPNISKDYHDYLAICDDLRDDEKEFFDKLCINPRLCDKLHSITIGQKKSFGGSYYVFGDFISYPKQSCITAEELYKRNFEYNFTDTRIHVGRFIFDIQCPHHSIKTIPKDLPNGCVCILFSL